MRDFITGREVRLPDCDIPIGGCIDAAILRRMAVSEDGINQAAVPGQDCAPCQDIAPNCIAYICAIKGKNSEIMLESESYDRTHADIPYGEGSLVILRRNADGSLTPISALSGMGNLRQIELHGSTAYITAREDGLWIVDISDVYCPRLLCHYDTVEFATAIAIHGRYAAIGCRNYGVELVDISIPERPRHISIIRAGEVQSVCFDGAMLYTGSWGEQKVVAIDASDALRPRTVSEIPLDGKGDGICVYDGILYAVTGQNARGMKRLSTDDPKLGSGNALEIFDVSNPERPIRLSRTLLVDRHYFIYNDMWDVEVSFPYAYVGHNYNGFYIFDVSKPEAPILLEHCMIPMPTDSRFFEESVKTLGERPYVLPFDITKEKFAPVGGFAIGEGEAYLAGILTDLHVVKSELCHPTHMSGTKRKIASDHYDYYMDAELYELRCGSQVKSAAWHEHRLYAACGEDGVKVFKPSSDAKIAAEIGYEYAGAIETEGSCDFVGFVGELMYLGEGNGGLSLWRIEDGEAHFLSRVGEGMSVRQVCVDSRGRFALAITSGTQVTVFDIRDAEKPQISFTHRELPGLLYGRQLSTAAVRVTLDAGGKLGCDSAADDIFACYWNSNTMRWFDLSGAEPTLLGAKQYRSPSFTGGAVSLDSEHALAVIGGGYVCFDKRDDGLKIAEGSITRIDGVKLAGVPSIFEDVCSATGELKRIMLVTDRLEGDIVLADITRLDSPRLIRKLKIPGNPDIAALELTESGKRIAAIPSGHQGIVFVDIT